MADLQVRQISPVLPAPHSASILSSSECSFLGSESWPNLRWIARFCRRSYQKSSEASPVVDEVQLIVRPAVVDAFCEPEAPVIVNVYVPAAGEVPAVRVNVLLVVPGFGENDAVTPVGNPETVS